MYLLCHERLCQIHDLLGEQLRASDDLAQGRQCGVHVLYEFDGVVALEQNERHHGLLLARLVARWRHPRLDQALALQHHNDMKEITKNVYKRQQRNPIFISRIVLTGNHT